MEAMEEWGHTDDRVMQRSYTAEVYLSSAWFIYEMHAHCHTCVGCALMEKQLEQGQHLTHIAVTGKPLTKWRSVEPSPHERTTRPQRVHL